MAWLVFGLIVSGLAWFWPSSAGYIAAPIEYIGALIGKLGALIGKLLVRFGVAGVCAALAWATFPGGQVFDKGLGSLTLGEIGGLVFAASCLAAAIRIAFADWD
jgi:hypothetical protein